MTMLYLHRLLIAVWCNTVNEINVNSQIMSKFYTHNTNDDTVVDFKKYKSLTGKLVMHTDTEANKHRLVASWRLLYITGTHMYIKTNIHNMKNRNSADRNTSTSYQQLQTYLHSTTIHWLQTARIYFAHSTTTLITQNLKIWKYQNLKIHSQGSHSALKTNPRTLQRLQLRFLQDHWSNTKLYHYDHIYGIMEFKYAQVWFKYANQEVLPRMDQIKH